MEAALTTVTLLILWYSLYLSESTVGGDTCSKVVKVLQCINTRVFDDAGSPFTVKVFGEGRMKESITRKRQAPSIATVGSTCDLNLKIPGELWHHLHPSPPVLSASPSSPLCPSFPSVLPPAGFRELVPHGFGSGASDPDVHTQQSHLHPHRADGDQQDASRRDEEGGARGGEHAGGRRALQRRLRRLPGTRESERLQRPPAAAGGCVWRSVCAGVCVCAVTDCSLTSLTNWMCLWFWCTFTFLTFNFYVSAAVKYSDPYYFNSTHTTLWKYSTTLQDINVSLTNWYTVDSIFIKTVYSLWHKLHFN